MNLDTNPDAENASKFECINCHFKCSKKSDWERHIMRPKHLNGGKDTKKTPPISTKFECLCGNIYKFKSGLYRHKNLCQKTQKNATGENHNINDVVINLINQNKELQQMLLEQNSKFFEMAKDFKTIQPNNTTNNNTTNNNNNHFNLHIYLNETCKNAVNLVDFVESLQVQLKDLEETAKLGYSEGVSNIFINGLNKLDVTMRPIHCSDAKRETLYIKDQNEWIKEDQSKTHITKAIKTVGKKNIQQIFEWQKKHPDYNDPDSRNNDKYLKMLYNVMNGSTDEEQIKNMDKIVKNIAKEVIIDKNI